MEFEGAEGFVRPVVFVSQQVRDEAARLAQTLGFSKTEIGLLDLRLRPFALVNVRQQDVPAHNMALTVKHTSPTHTKPAVCTVGASKALVTLVRLASLDGMHPQS